MTIDNYLALATALMSVANTIWLFALVLEIRRHNRERRAYNQRVSTPINTTPPIVRSIRDRQAIATRLRVPLADVK